MAEGKFAGVTQAMLDYYIGLALNNNREYYLATKDVYEREVRAPLLDLAETLAPAALQLDGEMEQRPGHILARIRRDTRFTRDKSPYRDHAWLSFRPMGRRKSGSLGLDAALGPQGCCYGAADPRGDPAEPGRVRGRALGPGAPGAVPDARRGLPADGAAGGAAALCGRALPKEGRLL